MLLAVIAAAGVFAYNWSQEQYYVAVADEKVAIFRGIQSDLPGLTLHRVAEETDVTVQSLPDYRAAQVRDGIPADDLDHAREIASEIRTDFARICPEPEPTPAPSKSPSADGTKKGDGKKGTGEQASPVAGAQPVSDHRTAGLHRGESERDGGGELVNTFNPLNVIPHGFTHRRRRGAELFLLVLSLFVGVGAYAAVGLAVEGELPVNILGYGGWLAALVIGCHLVVRALAPYADPVLLPIVSALNGLGLAMIHRIDLARLAADEDANTLARDQLIWMTLGVLLFVLVLVAAARPPTAPGVHLHLGLRRAPAARDAADARARHRDPRRPDLDQPRPAQLPAR